MSEYVILVDKDDNKIGIEEKVQCHLPNGKLHRAFTALIFDEGGRLLLTKRAKEKMLWPEHWDGTVASHPREHETYLSSTERRIPEELGVSCMMDYLVKFEYHISYKDVGSENEICGTLIGVVDGATEFQPIKKEISQTRWISASELIAEIKVDPRIYCPWMLIALKCLYTSEKTMLEKYRDVLSAWMSNDIIKELIIAIRTHMPDEDWRIIA